PQDSDRMVISIRKKDLYSDSACFIFYYELDTSRMDEKSRILLNRLWNQPFIDRVGLVIREWDLWEDGQQHLPEWPVIVKSHPHVDDDPAQVVSSEITILSTRVY